MTNFLIIVESAKKAKTIKGMLGRGYTVKATGGHILEMPRDDIHVDLRTFDPTLHLIRGKGKLLQQLQAAAAKADAVYLATDPDREGEAIARHVVSRLGSRATRKAKRTAFTAITERDVRNALAQPRNIDQNLVEAQTARRVIDRLVGYMVSPVLWAGLSGAKGLSAGRVQSPALWLVVARERAINAFVPEEWWSVDAELSRQENPSGQRFWAGLIKIRGKKPTLKNAEDARQVKQALEGADWRVLFVKKGQRLRRPYPPFTTDSLQQAASSQLGMPGNRSAGIYVLQS
jgi:DNA topoisomerase-1